MYRIGIDLGGTGIKAGVVDENNTIIEQTFAPTRTDRPANEIISDLCMVAESAMNLCFVNRQECLGVGIGSPGTCDPEAGKVLRAYNLGFKDVPICDLVNFRMGMPAKLANDADAAALGEVVAGAAKGFRSALFIGLGTGVGVGVIIDGKIYSGCGFGGIEAGHMKIQMDGELCTCGERGCFEAYASATALIRQAKKAAEENPGSALNQLEKISGKTIFEADASGDAVSRQVVDRYVEYLGVGISNLVNIYDPEIVVVGGGISGAGERILTPLREYVGKHIFGGEDRTPPQIVRAELGDKAGIIGAAALVG